MLHPTNPTQSTHKLTNTNKLFDCILLCLLLCSYWAPFPFPPKNNKKTTFVFVRWTGQQTTHLLDCTTHKQTKTVRPLFLSVSLTFIFCLLPLFSLFLFFFSHFFTPHSLITIAFIILFTLAFIISHFLV
ncbi:MAG: hypothetical protein BYD32DRAFT_206630 [Podila humilis]|nr:MAG: hypothetical protein BYD32DRAFT_206630 [Podila humilis]